MAGNEKTSGAVPLAVFALACFVTFAACTAMALGTWLGPEWGWSVAGAFSLLLYAVTARVLAKRLKEDGR